MEFKIQRKLYGLAEYKIYADDAREALTIMGDLFPRDRNQFEVIEVSEHSSLRRYPLLEEIIGIDAVTFHHRAMQMVGAMEEQGIRAEYYGVEMVNTRDREEFFTKNDTVHDEIFGGEDDRGRHREGRYDEVEYSGELYRFWDEIDKEDLAGIIIENVDLDISINDGEWGEHFWDAMNEFEEKHGRDLWAEMDILCKAKTEEPYDPDNPEFMVNEVLEHLRQPRPGDPDYALYYRKTVEYGDWLALKFVELAVEHMKYREVEPRDIEDFCGNNWEYEESIGYRDEMLSDSTYWRVYGLREALAVRCNMYPFSFDGCDYLANASYEDLDMYQALTSGSIDATSDWIKFDPKDKYEQEIERAREILGNVALTWPRLNIGVDRTTLNPSKENKELVVC